MISAPGGYAAPCALPAPCLSGKRSFLQARDARRAARRIRRAGDRGMRAYRCPRCDLWHIGHLPGTKKSAA